MRTDCIRRFFPSTEPELESDWEEIEAGESAENGPVVKDTQATSGASEETKVELPDVPTGSPVGNEHGSKELGPKYENKH
jgi:hypothetical protein